jgi:hypothetical protein
LYFCFRLLTAHWTEFQEAPLKVFLTQTQVQSHFGIIRVGYQELTGSDTIGSRGVACDKAMIPIEMYIVKQVLRDGIQKYTKEKIVQPSDTQL